MKRALLSARMLLVLPALALSGCMMMPGMMMGSMMGGMRHAPAEHTQASRGDAAFVAAMLPHHAHAVEMSRRVLRDGQDTAVRAFAQRVVDTQTRGIALLEEASRTLSEAGPAATRSLSMPHDGGSMNHGASGMGHTGSGMGHNTHDPLAAATGADLDRRYLDALLAHHAGGIHMAYRALPTLESPALRTFARALFDEQAQEIAEIHTLMQAVSPPDGAAPPDAHRGHQAP